MNRIVTGLRDSLRRKMSEVVMDWVWRIVGKRKGGKDASWDSGGSNGKIPGREQGCFDEALWTF